MLTHKAVYSAAVCDQKTLDGIVAIEHVWKIYIYECCRESIKGGEHICQLTTIWKVQTCPRFLEPITTLSHQLSGIDVWRELWRETLWVMGDSGVPAHDCYFFVLEMFNEQGGTPVYQSRSDSWSTPHARNAHHQICLPSSRDYNCWRSINNTRYRMLIVDILIVSSDYRPIHTNRRQWAAGQNTYRFYCPTVTGCSRSRKWGKPGKFHHTNTGIFEKQRFSKQKPVRALKLAQKKTMREKRAKKQTIWW